MLVCKNCHKIYFRYFKELDFFNRIEIFKKEKYLINYSYVNDLFLIDSAIINTNLPSSPFGREIDSYRAHYLCLNNHTVNKIYHLNNTDHSEIFKSLLQFINNNEIDLTMLSTKALISISQILKDLDEVKIAI